MHQHDRAMTGGKPDDPLTIDANEEPITDESTDEILKLVGDEKSGEWMTCDKADTISNTR